MADTAFSTYASYVTGSYASDLTASEAAIDNEFFEGPAHLYSASIGGTDIYGLQDAVRAFVGPNVRLYCWELSDDLTADGEEFYTSCDNTIYDHAGAIVVTYIADGLYSARSYEPWDC